MKSFFISLIVISSLAGCSTMDVFSNRPPELPSPVENKADLPPPAENNRTRMPLEPTRALEIISASSVGSEADVRSMTGDVSVETRLAFIDFMNHLHKAAREANPNASGRELKFSTSKSFPELLGIELGVSPGKCELGKAYEYGGSCFNDGGNFLCEVERGPNFQDYCFTKIILNR